MNWPHVRDPVTICDVLEEVACNGDLLDACNYEETLVYFTNHGNSISLPLAKHAGYFLISHVSYMNGNGHIVHNHGMDGEDGGGFEGYGYGHGYDGWGDRIGYKYGYGYGYIHDNTGYGDDEYGYGDGNGYGDGGMGDGNGDGGSDESHDMATAPLDYKMRPALNKLSSNWKSAFELRELGDTLDALVLHGLAERSFNTGKVLFPSSNIEYRSFTDRETLT